jgi:hypothetical protein
MPLYSPATSPHTVTILALTTSTDAGGGVSNAFATRTSAVKGYLNALSANEQLRFAQMDIIVSHQFSTTDVTAQRGDKLTFGSRSFHILGIRVTEAVGTIPRLCQLLLEEQL